MSRPPLEVADLVRTAGEAFIERSCQWIRWKHVKVLRAIAACRTAVLGGHVDQCTRCGHRAISYNSCRNRHCPKCQAGARDRWLAKRRQELLPTRYVHVVFTLPSRLAPLALQNKKIIYNLRSEEHTSELQSHSDLHSFPTRRSSDLTPPGVASDALRACGVHPAFPVGTLSPAKQEDHLQPAVPCQCRNTSPSGSRSATPRCRDRFLLRVAHMESTTWPSPPCSLRGSGRRAVARSHSLGKIAATIFSFHPRTASRFPRQVRGRSATGLP